MKGRGRSRDLAFRWPGSWAGGVLRAGARRQGAGVKLGHRLWTRRVDAGGEWRILVEDAPPMWRCFPSLRGGLCHGPEEAASHSFVDSRHDGFRPRPEGLNQKRRPRQSWRATAYVERASVRGRDSSGRGSIETSDPSVTHRVEHESEEFAGDGDSGLVLATALGDACVVGPELLVALGPVVADGLDGGPAHERRSLLICGVCQGQRGRLVGLAWLG